MHLRNYTLHPQEMEGENFQVTMVFRSYSRWSIESNAIAPKLWIPSNAGVVFFPNPSKLRLKVFMWLLIPWKVKEIKLLSNHMLWKDIRCSGDHWRSAGSCFLLSSTGWAWRAGLAPAGSWDPSNLLKIQGLVTLSFLFCKLLSRFLQLNASCCKKRSSAYRHIIYFRVWWVLKSRSNANKEEWDFGLETFQCFPTGTLTSSKEIRAVVWRKATPLDGGWGQKVSDGPC